MSIGPLVHILDIDGNSYSFRENLVSLITSIIKETIALMGYFIIR